MNKILEIIKNETDNSVLVSRSDIENFNNCSQLIVNESQEAIFYKDGQALDLFSSGRHELNSDNVPIFKRLFANLFGGKTPFTCQVYFINKVSVLDLLWGTDSPITLEDPKYHIIINVRSFGQKGIRVSDSRKFVVKVVGTMKEFNMDNVKRSIKGMLLIAVKEVLASAIDEKGISILQISSHLSELSSLVEEKLNANLDKYGLEVESFVISAINPSENDLEKLTEAKNKALEMTTLAEARARSRQVEGYTYQEQRQFDVLENAAKNNGVGGSMIGAGMGLGMGVSLGGISKDIAEQSMNNTTICPSCHKKINIGSKFSSFCGSKIETSRFCPECGTKISSSSKFCPNCGTKVGE